jgi:hypothetical protein
MSQHQRRSGSSIPNINPGRDLQLNPGDPEIGRILDLGTDPAIGAKFRIAEAETALRVESEVGVTLERAPEGAPYDWTDQAGNTYDAVGNFDAKYFDQQWPQLQGRIADHLGKADFVPVDVSTFTPAQVAKVEAYIQQFGSRVFIVGR